MSRSGLRVLTLTSYLPGIGGGELQTALQMRTLRQQGHHIEVFDLNPKLEASRFEELDGIPVTRSRASSLRVWQGVALQIDLLRWLWLRLRTADVVHFNHLAPALFTAATACWLWRVPLVLVVWGSSRPGIGPFGPGLRKALVRWLARRQSPVVALGTSNAKNLQAAGFVRESLHVIPNGVDTQRFCPVADKSKVRAELELRDGPLAVSVGRLVPAKAYDLLIMAWRSVRAELPEARLILVGDGPERPSLLRLVKESGLSDHVSLVGLRRDVPRWLAACDLYISSSRTEGMSNAILEALASGLPVVATRVGAAGDVIRPGEDGEIVEPGDPVTLARAVLRILGCPDERARMARAARDQAKREFEIGRITRRYTSVYRRASGKQRDT